LQKCTRVITRDKTDIVSSYNLGEFRKMLEPYGFYSPHKSHLINLNYIRKYHKEGNILMVNHSYVPVAKRKKKEFLNQVKHI
jgi:two-component system LytT family response regulator